MKPWKELSMQDRAKFIKHSVNSGITSLNDIREAYNSFAIGGPTQTMLDLRNNTPFYTTTDNPTPRLEAEYNKEALERARSEEAVPNINFNYAQDMSRIKGLGTTTLLHTPPIVRKTVDKLLHKDPRTCINTVTGFYDPYNTVASNMSMVEDPERYGYKEINQEDLIPGDIMILHDKNNHPKHAVMFDSIAEEDGEKYGYPILEGDTLVNYSNGGVGRENYRVQAPLTRFRDPANSGGDFSGISTYYRRIKAPSRELKKDDNNTSRIDRLGTSN